METTGIEPVSRPLHETPLKSGANQSNLANDPLSRSRDWEFLIGGGYKESKGQIKEKSDTTATSSFSFSCRI